jgi:segregation and condensation protein B
MVMRLVRDDDYYDGPMTLDQEEQTSRHGQGAATDDGDADGIDGATDAQLLDAQDGTAIDLLEEDDASESADASTAPQVNLAALEALLLSTHHPLTAGRLAELLDLETTKPLRKAIKALNEQYASTDRSFRIEQVAGGFQILTLPEHGDLLKRFHQKEVDAKLTKAAIETLAIIAYKQPILRADVEAIRGVACGETIRSLMEKRLVKIAGRAEEPGRPILYGTTKRFLELFGLNSIKDLPQPEALLEKANG